MIADDDRDTGRMPRADWPGAAPIDSETRMETEPRRLEMENPGPARGGCSTPQGIFNQCDKIRVRYRAVGR